MTNDEFGKTVRASELEEGDTVTVHVNGRAARQLGAGSFRAVVEDVAHWMGEPDVVFRPVEQLQPESETHTWYSNIGYIHGYHDGLERHSDIGKVLRVTR